MSFSTIVKNEICRLEMAKSCCTNTEMRAILDVHNLNDKSILKESRIITENPSFARRFFTIIKEITGFPPRIIIRKNKKLKKNLTYIIDFERALVDNYNKDLSPQIKKLCCKKAYLRGAFLAGGSVSHPEKQYHLEINYHNIQSMEYIKEILHFFEINGKTLVRNVGIVVYIKEGEDLVKFINIIGAHNSLMELENVRILKEMRNSVNRIVNCETANLEKTINASFRQVENIKYIQNNLGVENLSENMKEIAKLRLKNPDANLQELGEMMEPNLGKSGVNHRLRKLEELAENLKKKKGEGND